MSEYTQSSRSKLSSVLSATLLTLLLPVAAAQTETWVFDLQTSGADTFWTSATAVDNTAAVYHGAYELSLVEVTVSYLEIPFGPFDVTDQIPPEAQAGEARHAGPPPFTIVDDHVRTPPEPDPAALEGDLLMAVDAAGYGQGALTNIVLGTVSVDLGFPFGVIDAQIETVHVVGTVSITPLVAGDVDGDGDVDLADLAALLASYGLCDTDINFDPYADVDFSACVELADLATLLANYGFGS
jgi:hypothetical protein